MSRFYGKDSTTCGTPLLPCRSIHYVLDKVLEGSLVYLDGTGTSKDPYTCNSLNTSQVGIYLTKSVSFVGIKSRAYISCLYGKHWLVDGTKRKGGLSVSFYRVAFRNTSLWFLDATAYINDSLLTDSKNAAINLISLHLTLVSLTLKGVVFQQNTVCISQNSGRKITIFVHLTNSVFIRNGNGSSASASILWFSSKKHVLDIQIRNCSFQENKLNKYGMIYIWNKKGSTNISIHQFKLQDTGNSGISCGLIILTSAQIIIDFDFGFVSRIYGTLFLIDCQSSKISVSNIKVDKFYSSDEGGGVFNIINEVRGLFSIKDSCFRNGRSSWLGGVVVISSQKLNLMIQNSIIQNVTNTDVGGMITVVSFGLFRTVSPSTKFFIELNIINSSFIDNVSNFGGVLHATVENVKANITNSLFLRNSVTNVGAAFLFTVNKATEVFLRNVRFIQNSAGVGSVVFLNCTNVFQMSQCNFTADNVWFIENKQGREQSLIYGILEIFVPWNTSSIVSLKNSFFIENNSGHGTVIFFNLLKNPEVFHFVTIDSCVLKKNFAKSGVLTVYGQATMICKHSVFDSNTCIPACEGSAISILMLNSINAKITVANSTFVNNSWGAITAGINNAGYFEIENSRFVRNRRINGSGGALYFLIKTVDNKVHNSSRSGMLTDSNVFIRNVWFQENVATAGGVLVVANGKIKLSNCVFINNFAQLEGGHVNNYGSNEMEISHSVFKETKDANFSTNGTKFTASGFLRIYGSGRFQLRNTTSSVTLISEEPLFFVARAKDVTMDKSSVTTCPLGSGVRQAIYKYRESNDGVATILQLYCQKCEYNFYSLQRGQSEGKYVNKDSFVCTPCPRGANCLPAIKSKANFWGYLVDFNPPKLAFAICPFGYCKSPKLGSSNYNECEGRRTGIMCGMCSKGHTETLLSTYCTPNENCKDYWFWALFLALVFSMAGLLVFKPSFLSCSLKQVLWLKKFIFRSTNRQVHELQEAMNLASSYEESTVGMRAWSSTAEENQKKRQFTCLLEIIFYFYQIARLLLSSYSLREFFGTKFLTPVLGFFNFQPSFNEHGSLCPFPGLTPTTKSLFKVAPVFGTLLAISIIYLFNLAVNKFRGEPRPSTSSYLQASIKTISLGYVKLAIVSISLVRCVSVADETRWFYNGNIICYQWWQYGSFVFIAFFVIPFLFILAWTSFKIEHDAITVKQFLVAIVFPLPTLVFWLFRSACSSERMNIEDSQNLKALEELILGPYKRHEENQSNHGAAPYWQSILIARRLILVVLYCMLTEPFMRLFCMTVVCVLVLCSHFLVKPFKNSFANNLESLSLLFLVILGLINLCKSVFFGANANIEGTLVTVFKIFQWIEFVILGLFPILLSILMCLAIFSLTIRILFICCRSVFNWIFRCFGQRWNTHDGSRLLNICEERDSGRLF